MHCLFPQLQHSPQEITKIIIIKEIQQGGNLSSTKASPPGGQGAPAELSPGYGVPPALLIVGSALTNSGAELVLSI